MASRKIGFDPVAKPEQRPSRACVAGKDSWTQRHRPVLAKCLFPDQLQVQVRCTGDFDLIQRYAGSKDSTENLLDLGFTPSGMKQLNLLVRRCLRCGCRSHKERKQVRLNIRLGPLHGPRYQPPGNGDIGKLKCQRGQSFANH